MDKKAEGEAEKLIKDGANIYQVINKTGLDMTQVSAIMRRMKKELIEGVGK